MFARLLPGPRIIDDAFITYRYVHNLINGNGLVYNPGERVLGTTTPFYSLLLALLSSILQGGQGNLPIVSIFLNAVADSAGCLLLFAIGRSLGWSAAGFGAALVWAVAPFSVTFSIGGLETSIVVFLILAAWYTYLVRKTFWTALFAALLILTRPDTLILVAPLALDHTLQILKILNSHKKESKKFSFATYKPHIGEILALVMPLTGWVTFAALYYGSPVPHSITAKSLAYQISSESALVRLLQHYSTPFMEQYSLDGSVLIGLGVLYLFLSILGGWIASKNNRRSWPFLIYPWLYLIVFSMANPLIFRWYLTPPLPAYILSILIGAQHLVQKGLTVPLQWNALQKSGQSKLFPITAQSILALIIIVIPFSLTLQGWSLLPGKVTKRPVPKMAWIELEVLYHQVSEQLTPRISAQSNPSIVIAAGDVGVLGYYTGAKILDLVGLISPQATRYYPADEALYLINYAIPPDLVMDNLPDFLVILEIYGRAGLLKDARFLEAYQLIEKIETDIYGSDGLLVYELRKP